MTPNQGYVIDTNVLENVQKLLHARRFPSSFTPVTNSLSVRKGDVGCSATAPAIGTISCTAVIQLLQWAVNSNSGVAHGIVTIAHGHTQLTTDSSAADASTKPPSTSHPHSSNSSCPPTVCAAHEAQPVTPPLQMFRHLTPVTAAAPMPSHLKPEVALNGAGDITGGAGSLSPKAEPIDETFLNFLENSPFQDPKHLGRD
ncbi:hypothetical protein EI94DRAFT_1160832 [Lactarius quietus]|nr:hypothetical protein EI94DRAFT_1160832 [Lactarius quietus]